MPLALVSVGRVPLALVSVGRVAPHDAETAAAVCHVRHSLDQIDTQSALDQRNHVDPRATCGARFASQQLEAVASAVPDACCRVHFVRVLDLHSEALLLVGNIYQAQASQPEQQDVLLNLISRVIERWGGLSDHVMIGGDWNASLQQRIGYSNIAHIGWADARLR